MIVELREWLRLSEDLTRERVRLANRMREQLWHYYPQFLHAVDDDVAAALALNLWRNLPTPRAGQRIREVTLARVLKQHRIRRIATATLRDRLREPPRYLRKIATRCGGGTTTRGAVSAEWLRSLGIQARDCSSRAVWPPTIDYASPPTTVHRHDWPTHCKGRFRPLWADLQDAQPQLGFQPVIVTSMWLSLSWPWGNDMGGL